MTPAPETARPVPTLTEPAVVAVANWTGCTWSLLLAVVDEPAVATPSAKGVALESDTLLVVIDTTPVNPLTLTTGPYFADSVVKSLICATTCV
jgi:hypothetical protein